MLLYFQHARPTWSYLIYYWWRKCSSGAQHLYALSHLSLTLMIPWTKHMNPHWTPHARKWHDVLFSCLNVYLNVLECVLGGVNHNIIGFCYPKTSQKAALYKVNKWAQKAKVHTNYSSSPHISLDKVLKNHRLWQSDNSRLGHIPTVLTLTPRYVVLCCHAWYCKTKSGLWRFNFDVMN